MEKGDQTGIAGIAIGFGLGVAAMVLPWDIPAVTRHILFWVAVLLIVGGFLHLLDLHYLRRSRRRTVRFLVPVIALAVFLCAIALFEGSRSLSSPSFTDTNSQRRLSEAELLRDGSRLTFADIPLKDLGQKQYTLPIQIRNTGKLPLTSVQPMFFYAAVSQKMTPEQELGWASDQERLFKQRYPNLEAKPPQASSPFQEGIDFELTNPSLVLTGSDFADVIRGKRFIYKLLLVVYRDALVDSQNTFYYSAFCSVLESPTLTYEPCYSFNFRKIGF